MWELAAASLHGFRSTLDADGFTEVHSPKLVESATESGANVFEVDYFGRPAYLAQSPQFYKQVLVGVFERVYEVGPVFRAEPHDTVRHLAEYVSLDVELGFVRDHHDVIACLRDTVAGMVAAIHERAGHAVELLGIDVPAVPEEFPTLHFREALEIAGAPADEPDLAPAHERALGEWAQAEHGSDFVVVHGYPTAHRAFYSHPDPDEPHWSRSFDLIFRGLELVSGAQRLHRYADYVRTLEERGYPYAPYASYVEAFRPASRRTAASRSASSAGSAGSPARRTSGRSRCSRATCTGWRRSGSRRADLAGGGLDTQRSTTACQWSERQLQSTGEARP